MLITMSIGQKIFPPDISHLKGKFSVGSKVWIHSLDSGGVVEWCCVRSLQALGSC